MRLFHVVQPFRSQNQEEQERMGRAAKTWYQLYGSSAGMIRPAHVVKLHRDARSIGDTRDTLFVKDMIEYGFKVAGSELGAAGTNPGVAGSNPGAASYIMLTNADSCLCQETGSVVFEALARNGACFSTRRDTLKIQRSWLSQEQIMSRCEPFVGVDLVAMSLEWWMQQRDSYPDMLQGYQGWDFCFKYLMGVGLETVPVVYHQMHDPFWARHRTMAAGQVHNRRLAYEWAKSQPNWAEIKRDWAGIESYGSGSSPFGGSLLLPRNNPGVRVAPPINL